MHGGQSDLHIIFHGRGQKLSIPNLTPYKQSAEENGRVQREVRHLCGQTETPNAAKTTCWILLVRPEPKDGKRIFANPDNFVNKAEKTNHLVNVSITKITRFIIQESKMLLVSFCVLVVATGTIFFVNSDSFWRGTQPNQLPQLDHSERTEYCRSYQKIHNVANSAASVSSTKGARMIVSAKTATERRDTAAGGWVLRQRSYVK